MASGLFFLPGQEAVETSPAPDYVRPPAWPEIVASGPAEEKVTGLYAVWPGTESDAGPNFFSAIASGDYTINYGDGVIASYNGGEAATHRFDYNSPALAGTNAPVSLVAATATLNRLSHGHENGDQITLFNLSGSTGILANKPYYVINKTSDTFQLSETINGPAIAFSGNGSATLLPYKTAIVTITPQAGQQLTEVDLGYFYGDLPLSDRNSSGWLDLAISMPNAAPEGLRISSANYYGSRIHRFLEKCTVVNHGGATSFYGIFASCCALRKVVIASDISDVTDMSQMFLGCSSLRSAPAFNGVIDSVTTMAQMFQDCASLREVPPFNGTAANIAYMDYMFQNCKSLESIPAFPGSTEGLASAAFMFSGCSSLKTIPPFPVSTASLTYFQYMFSDCTSLQVVPPFPSPTPGFVSVDSMFAYCPSLVTLPPMDLSEASSVSDILVQCASVSRVPFSGVRQFFSVAGLPLSASALNELFGLLGSVSPSYRAIFCGGCYGVQEPGFDPEIAMAKGWTVFA